MQKLALSAEEIKILSKLSVEELQQLVNLKESGKMFAVLLTLVNIVVDIEKNYAFALTEDDQLGVKHAFSRGKAAFATEFMHLIAGASSELARRQKIQHEIKAKQLKNHEQ